MAGFVGSPAVPAAAKTKSHTDCQTPPTMSGILRPNWGGRAADISIYTTKLKRGVENTHSLHLVQATEGAEEVDGAENDLRDEGVLDADRFEDRRAVLSYRNVNISVRKSMQIDGEDTHVEEVVGAGELLEGLQHRDWEHNEVSQDSKARCAWNAYSGWCGRSACGPR